MRAASAQHYAAFPALAARSGLAGKIATPCFSPKLRVTHRITERDSGFPTRFMLPTVAPGQNPGVLRIASAVLHILSRTNIAPGRTELNQLSYTRHSGSPYDRAKGSAGTFQRGKFPALTHFNFTSPETRFSNSTPNSANFGGTHGTQQAWINSRNLTTIATTAKHRQPIFLHPTVRDRAIRKLVIQY
jgi:hypothetical protein